MKCYMLARLRGQKSLRKKNSAREREEEKRVNTHAPSARRTAPRDRLCFTPGVAMMMNVERT